MEQIAENFIAGVIRMHAIGKQGSVHTAVWVAKCRAEVPVVNPGDFAKLGLEKLIDPVSDDGTRRNFIAARQDAQKKYFGARLDFMGPHANGFDAIGNVVCTIDAGIIRADFDDDEFGRYAVQFTMINPPENIFGAIPSKTQVLHGHAGEGAIPNVGSPRFWRHRFAAPVMADRIPDENDFRLVRAIELDHCGMAGWPIINGVIPVLSHRSRGRQPLIYFRAGCTTRQNQRGGGDNWLENAEFEFAHVIVMYGIHAKVRRQSPFPPAGNTEISAALVQPLFQMACKLVKRK